MSAANPVSASTTDQKPREPSMEEILASIRRIIADDQSLPGRGAIRSPDRPADAVPPALPPEETFTPQGHEDRVADLPVAPESSPRAEEYLAPGSSALTHAQTTEWGGDPARPHGTIAAPQFAMPDGPANDGDYFEGSTPVDKISEAREPISAHVGADDVVDASSRHGDEPPSMTRSTERTDVAQESDRGEHLYATPLEREHEPEETALLFSAATDTSIQSAFNMLAATRLADNSEELKAMVREMIRPLLRSWLDDNLPSMVERMVRMEIERVARGGR